MWEVWMRRVNSPNWGLMTTWTSWAIAASYIRTRNRVLVEARAIREVYRIVEVTR